MTENNFFVAPEKFKGLFKNYTYIASAYLFGSQASGKALTESDVDIAILLKDNAPKERELIHEEDYLAYRMAVMLGVKEVDLISLNGKGIVFQHNVLRTGTLIYDSDSAFRIKFETEVISRFCNFEPTLRYIEKIQRQSRIERFTTP